jgi:hypothetical protein
MRRAGPDRRDRHPGALGRGRILNHRPRQGDDQDRPRQPGHQHAPYALAGTPVGAHLTLPAATSPAFPTSGRQRNPSSSRPHPCPGPRPRRAAQRPVDGGVQLRRRARDHPLVAPPSSDSGSVSCSRRAYQARSYERDHNEHMALRGHAPAGFRADPHAQKNVPTGHLGGGRAPVVEPSQCAGETGRW